MKDDKCYKNRAEEGILGVLRVGVRVDTVLTRVVMVETEMTFEPKLEGGEA